MRRIAAPGRMVAMTFVLMLLCRSMTLGQAPPSPADSSAAEPPAKQSATQPTQPTQPGVPSDAERISSIQNVLKEDKERLSQLRRELEQLDGEFESTSQAFNRLDEQLPADEKPAADAAPNRADLTPQQQAWVEARDAFNITIARRKAVAGQIEAIKEKITIETEALDRLTTTEPVPAATATADRDADTGAPPAADPAGEEPLSLPGLSALTPSATLPQTVKKSASADPQRAAASSSAEADAGIIDRRLSDAKRSLDEAKSRLRTTEVRVEQLSRVEQSFERNLTATQELLDADRRGLELAQQQLQTANERLAAAPAGDSPERTQFVEQQSAAQQRLADAQRLVSEHAARLDELQAQIEQIRTARESAAQQLDDAQIAVDGAERWVWFFSSPLSPHRVVRWLVLRGPNVLVILFLMILFWWLSRSVGRRVIAQLALRSHRGNAAEREMRADTLRRVFQSTASVVILASGILALLNQTGFDVTVLLGGAAVIGAAVAFGSQNLIKDYFSGFMILVENQYSVGNVIRIGDISGSVEDISLRMTVLRDLEGVVHFIPHSQVTTVSNLTHGWSRVVIDVGVAYHEDIDRVMEVLMDLARELRDDETFGPKMLGEPEMLGVESLGESAVVVRFLVKTRPLKQWEVKRELLRRVKKRFDKLGIEIPFPHRTVFHRDLDVRLSPPGSSVGKIE